MDTFSGQALPRLVAQTIDSGDVGDIVDAFGFPDLRVLQLAAPQGRHRLVHGRLGPISFRSVETSGRYYLTWRVPARVWLLQLDLGSTAPRRICGREIGRDAIVLSPPGAEVMLHTAPVDMAATGATHPRHRGISFVIPAELVDEARGGRAPECADAGNAGGGVLIFEEPTLVHRLRALAGGMLEAAAAPAAFGASTTVELESLVHTLLAPWQEGPAQAFHRPYCQRLPIVRRCEDFMRANLGEALGLREICRAARACERTVEYAFREVHGVGAKHFLKLLRLNEVRRTLRQAGSGDLTIRTVAHAAGLNHMGHFSAAYRELFGQLPSQTPRCPAANLSVALLRPAMVSPSAGRYTGAAIMGSPR